MKHVGWVGWVPVFKGELFLHCAGSTRNLAIVAWNNLHTSGGDRWEYKKLKKYKMIKCIKLYVEDE